MVIQNSPPEERKEIENRTLSAEILHYLSGCECILLSKVKELAVRSWKLHTPQIHLSTAQRGVPSPADDWILSVCSCSQPPISEAEVYMTAYMTNRKLIDAARRFLSPPLSEPASLWASSCPGLFGWMKGVLFYFLFYYYFLSFILLPYSPFFFFVF